MKFRTEYLPQKVDLTLDPTHPVVLVGSCFTDNIARKMEESFWPAFHGVGTLYNPLSIAKVLDLLIFKEDFLSAIDDSLFQSEGYTHSWLFDSHFSRISTTDCIKAIEDSRGLLTSALERAQALIVTFGTSWCYYLEEKEDYVVANCHKMPQSKFLRKRVSMEVISKVWTNLCQRLNDKFPNLNIIFTVSPVRHIKDGFDGNSRSKATLILAVEDICANIPYATYFPAFEIVNDDLRDYRFYASDLVHPSDQAVEYIWEMFVATFIDSKGQNLLKEGNKTYKRINHRRIKN